MSVSLVCTVNYNTLSFGKIYCSKTSFVTDAQGNTKIVCYIKASAISRVKVINVFLH